MKTWTVLIALAVQTGCFALGMLTGGSSNPEAEAEVARDLDQRVTQAEACEKDPDPKRAQLCPTLYDNAARLAHSSKSTKHTPESLLLKEQAALAKIPYPARAFGQCELAKSYNDIKGNPDKALALMEPNEHWDTSSYVCYIEAATKMNRVAAAHPACKTGLKQSPRDMALIDRCYKTTQGGSPHEALAQWLSKSDIDAFVAHTNEQRKRREAGAQAADACTKRNCWHLPKGSLQAYNCKRECERAN